MAAIIPNIFFLNSTGEILIEKQWFGHLDRQICDAFSELQIQEEQRSNLSPIISSGRYYFLHTLRNDVLFLTVTDQETNPGLILEFHQNLIQILLTYIGSINESVICDHFVLVYQLLDEMIQGGFPLTIEMNQLLDMIAPPSLTNKMLDVLSIGSPTTTLKGDLSTAATSKIPWRRDNVHYLKNAVYFDIIENIDAVIDVNGNLISSIVQGEIECKCHLSGIPDMSLTLKHNPLIDNIALHRCVRLARYERDRVISFVPPDGNFTLCRFKIDSGIHVPLYVRPEFVWTKDRCTFTISIGQKIDPVKLPLQDITIIIPIPEACSATVTHTNIGTVRTDQLTHTCRWEIPAMPKDHHSLKNNKFPSKMNPTTPTITGVFTLTRDIPADERPTLRALFNVTKFSPSQTNIDGLVVHGVNYQPVRGVRNICKAGRFQIRTQ